MASKCGHLSSLPPYPAASARPAQSSAMLQGQDIAHSGAHPEHSQKPSELPTAVTPLLRAERVALQAPGGPFLPAHSWVGQTIPH